MGVEIVVETYVDLDVGCVVGVLTIKVGVLTVTDGNDDGIENDTYKSIY